MVAFIGGGARLISSGVVMTEAGRAAYRTAADDPNFDLAAALRMADTYLELIRLHPIRWSILRRAANFPDPRLQTLDAIHVVTALEARPIDFFVTYDERQAKAARRAGLPTVSPGRVRG